MPKESKEPSKHTHITFKLDKVLYHSFAGTYAGRGMRKNEAIEKALRLFIKRYKPEQKDKNG